MKYSEKNYCRMVNEFSPNIQINRSNFSSQQKLETFLRVWNKIV